MSNRLIFMGSDPIALRGLNAVMDGRCGPIELIAVYTQPDRARGRGKKVVPNEIKVWAEEREIPVHQPERMTKGVRQEIAELKADAILVMAYGHLLSQKLIDTPPLGIWNLHTSLLPRYRGASPIQSAVANGDDETGVSLMKLVREMDAGPVLDIEKVSIEMGDTALDIEARLAAACSPLLRRGLPTIFEGEWPLREQDASEVSYVRKLGKDDGELDFRIPAGSLACRINGLFPWPSARFCLGDVAIKVGQALPGTDSSQGEPGEVIGLREGGLEVACGVGTILLMKLQRPGGKMLPAAEFLRGFEISQGTIIESKSMPQLIAAQPFKA